MTSLRRSLPSSNSLFVFEAAARQQSFTKAAEDLNVTQPAVSRTLARLERHLSSKLFERSNDGVSLTENGKLLFQAVTDGFQTIEAALVEIKQRQTGLEIVTLSISSGFATHWLMPRIGALQKACPTVDLRFQLIPGAVKGPVVGVDLGMRFVPHQERDANGTFVVNEVILPICSPAYLERRDAAGDEAFIHLGDGDLGWIDQLRRSGGRYDLLRFSDYSVVLQAALLGQGVALGWINVVTHWLRTGALVPAGPPVVTKRYCCLTTPRARPAGTTTVRVRDWLIEEIRRDLDAVEERYPHFMLRQAALRPMT